MRNVIRLGCPISLKKDGRKWRKDLLDKIKECKKTRSKVPEKYYSKYNKRDTKSCLTKMYNKLCCYCEGEIGIVDFPHIEHRLPKSIYPKYCYEWENLHLACTKCNVSKGDKFDKKNPVLDAVKDNPVDNHIFYHWDEVLGIVCSYKTIRGKNTIAFTNLNRDELNSTRLKILHDTFNIINEIHDNPESTFNEIKLKELKRKTEGTFGSVISWSLSNFRTENT